MPEAPQLLDYQEYVPFTRLARFITRVTLLSKSLIQLVARNRAVSQELRELAELLVTDDQRWSNYLIRLREIAAQGPVPSEDTSDGLPSAEYLNSVSLASAYQNLVDHALDDTVEMQFKTRRFDEAFNKLNDRITIDGLDVSNLTRRDQKTLKKGGGDAIEAAMAVLGSLALGVPLIGGLLSELVQAIADVLRQLFAHPVKEWLKRITRRGDPQPVLGVP